MPVVNLPRDDRWGKLGEGLGGIAAGLLNAYNDKQMATTISEIPDDPKDPNKKPAKILEKLGRPGLDLYDKLTAQQQRQAVITHALAGAKLQDLQAQAQAEQLKYLPDEVKAKLGLTAAQTSATQAETGLRGAETARVQALTGPQVDEANASATLRTAEAGKSLAETDILNARVSAMRQAQQQGSDTKVIDTMLAPFASSLQPQQLEQWRTSLQQTYQGAELKSPGSGQAAAASQLRALTSTISKIEQPKPLDSAERKVAGQAAEYATTIKSFADTLKDNPDEVGLLTGSSLKGWLERHGVASGDPALLTLMETQQQAVGQQARGGSVFMSGQTIKLAQDIAPRISRSPMANVIAINTIADQKIAELQNNLLGYEGTAVQTKPIKDAISRWQEVKNVTGTLKTQVEPDAQGRPARTIVYFGDAQVDPSSFKPLVKNDDTKYSIQYDGKTRTVPGAWLFEAARAKGKDPYKMYLELGGRAQ